MILRMHSQLSSGNPVLPHPSLRQRHFPYNLLSMNDMNVVVV